MRKLTLPREYGIAVKLYYREYGLYLREVQSFLLYRLFILQAWVCSGFSRGLLYIPPASFVKKLQIKKENRIGYISEKIVISALLI